MAVVNTGAESFNLHGKVCEIVTANQDVVGDFEVLVYLNGERELLFIRESRHAEEEITTVDLLLIPGVETSIVVTPTTDTQVEQPCISLDGSPTPSTSQCNALIETAVTVDQLNQTVFMSC